MIALKQRRVVSHLERATFKLRLDRGAKQPKA
jgi:hypothetical protein